MDRQRRTTQELPATQAEETNNGQQAASSGPKDVFCNESRGNGRTVSFSIPVARNEVDTNSETSSSTAELFDRIVLNEVHTDADVVELPLHDLDKTEDAWGFCLIAYFPTRITGEADVHGLCNSWKIPCSFTVHSSGWIIFEFDNEEDRDVVLNAGPCYCVSGRSLFLKNMPKFFKFDNHEIRHVLTWIMLPCLPLECWNAICLSRIVSKVGKPLYTDMETGTKEKVDFARVLVEVDASKELVRNVKIRLPDGEYKQRVVFEQDPKFCTNCKRFGHHVGNCLRRKERIPTTVLEQNEQLDQAADVESRVQTNGKMIMQQVPSKQKHQRRAQALSIS